MGALFDPDDFLVALFRSECDDEGRLEDDEFLRLLQQYYGLYRDGNGVVADPMLPVELIDRPGSLDDIGAVYKAIKGHGRSFPPRRWMQMMVADDSAVFFLGYRIVGDGTFYEPLNRLGGLYEPLEGHMRFFRYAIRRAKKGDRWRESEKLKGLED